MYDTRNLTETMGKAWESLCRRHYRVYKSGRLRMKAAPDMSGAVVPVPEGQPTQIRAYATTENVDIEGDVVLAAGMESSYFELNRTLFVDHNYEAMSAVGKLRNLIKPKGGVIVESVLIDNPQNPLVAQIRALAMAGNIGQSIGFEALEYGAPTPDELRKYPEAKAVHRAWRLLEVSYTALPMNPYAQDYLTPAEVSAAPEPKTVIII